MQDIIELFKSFPAINLYLDTWDLFFHAPTEPKGPGEEKFYKRPSVTKLRHVSSSRIRTVARSIEDIFFLPHFETSAKKCFRLFEHGERKQNNFDACIYY